ncbi:MAG: molybdopterin dinucleotide binding domain-containing protein [Candidatus Bathyarchaeia archaeon]
MATITSKIAVRCIGVSRIQVTLLTGRSLGQGRAKEQGKLSELYLESVACCEVQPEDLQNIGLEYGKNIRVTSNHGSVVVKAVMPTQPLPRGVVFMPYSIWATQVLGSDTDGTGMPTYKCVSCTIEPAIDEKIMSIEELTKKFPRKMSRS